MPSGAVKIPTVMMVRHNTERRLCSASLSASFFLATWAATLATKCQLTPRSSAEPAARQPPPGWAPLGASCVAVWEDRSWFLGRCG